MTEAQVHQSYNALWLEGIFDGYRRNVPDKRPFMMSRSGGIGIQAYGGAMWSGDTGGDFGSLAAQMPQQTHMMWSGIDYYGSDVGGFHRAAMGVYPGTHEELTDELYTQWLAYSAMFEVPVRPHTENLCNCKETSPDRIGDLESNLANLRLRYELLPYYYSVAHWAARRGEPVFPSVDYWFPDAPGELGHVKMIGPNLLSAAVAEPGAAAVDVYLPEGDWYDFRSGAPVSGGGTIMAPLRDEGGHFRLPLFVRDGGAVPVEGGVLNVFGTAETRFEWIDDDGSSTRYRRGDLETIRVIVSEPSVELIRGTGNTLEPKRLRWVRPDAAQIKRIVMNSRDVAFAVEGNAIEVALPPFGERLFVEAIK
jgi:alpha-glucosidase